MLKTVTNQVNVSQITGVLPVVNGGTGVTTSTGTGSTVLSAAPTLSGNVTFSTGNLVIGTAGKGIDFSATPGTGTSELLDDYEEGTWTPTVASFSGSITSYTSAGTYTKVGRQVTVNCIFTITDNGTGATLVLVTGLPFTPDELTTLYAGSGNNRSLGASLSVDVANGRIQIYTYAGVYPGATGQSYCVSATYDV
jgi:hypothetical protein